MNPLPPTDEQAAGCHRFTGRLRSAPFSDPPGMKTKNDLLARTPRSDARASCPFASFELSKYHPPRRCLEHAGDHHGALLTDEPLPALDDDHRAVVEISDSLSAFLAVLDDYTPASPRPEAAPASRRWRSSLMLNTVTFWTSATLFRLCWSPRRRTSPARPSEACCPLR